MTLDGAILLAEGGMPPPSFELPARVGNLCCGTAGWRPLNVQFAPLTVGVSTASALKFPWHNRVSRSANSGKELIGNPMAGAKACAYHDTRSTLWRVTGRDDDH